jgi:hypothetical protein
MRNCWLMLLCFLQICGFAEPIDIVYTWVDGADSDWQKLRNQNYAEWYTTAINPDANSNNRFRNHDELKYSLRSIVAYANWVNHIYIVTAGQCPAWLKEHPMITIIDHKDIFKEASDLPTFNSHAIESNLHRIPNLSEKYIYLNDDVLFASRVDEEDFFTSKGKIRIHFSKHRVRPGPVVPHEPAYDSAWKNTDALLDSTFVSEERYKLAHAPFPFTKSLVRDVEDQFPAVFQQLSSHKFRSPTDYTLTNGLIQYYALYMNRARVGNEAIGKVLVRDDVEKNDRNFRNARKKKCKFLCVQDLSHRDDHITDMQLSEFFEKMYPNPAPWESDLMDPL